MTTGFADHATLTVYPEITRSVKGFTELERKRYFSIADDGRGFDQRILDNDTYDYLVNDLGISFGRQLGPVKAAVLWEKAVIEDTKRPGYADIEYLKKKYAGRSQILPSRMYEDFGPNLNVAAHGDHNVFPGFMGKYTTPEAEKGPHAEYLPENIDAAAELSAAVMKYAYNDFTRPAYYEPLNEPHWAYHKGDHIAQWHLRTKEEVQKLSPDVKVGGYCSSVSYFFQDEYRVWDSFEKFMLNTDGKLDFYSFHTYDYYRLESDTIVGRVQSGLPLEGTFDMVAASASNHFGEEKPIVVSEHGGSPWDTPPGAYRGEKAAGYLAEKHFPRSGFSGSDFEWEMKKRSIIDFVHVSSMIANTMTFLDHPHVLKKAVPFVLLHAYDWDPKYYAVLYVPNNYADKTDWVPSGMVNYYKFFQGVKGRRVQFFCSDPDVQTQAFVDGNKVYVVMNNLSSRPETIRLKGINGDAVRIRRFGRNQDFTPFFKEGTLDVAEELILDGREAVVITAEQDLAIEEVSAVNELPFYGDCLCEKGRGGEPITLHISNLPVDEDLEYAILRVALAQEENQCEGVRIFFNGEELVVPSEDAADRYFDDTEKRGSDFATLKAIRIRTDLLQSRNELTVLFPNGQRGAVGSAVIRLGIRSAADSEVVTSLAEINN
ncbi:MAG: beta-agarase [Coraliomargaritaceae bacterium]